PGVETAEHVDEAELVEHPREPRPLFGQEAGVLLIGAPVPQIDLAMGDVPVAAQQHFAPTGAQAGEVRKEPVHEAELHLLALGRARPGGEVDRYDAEIAEIRLQITPFRVDILDAQAALDPVGDAAGIDADAAV